MSPLPCLWIRDLDDTVTVLGQKMVEAIRQQCQCEECKQLREKVEKVDKQDQQ